MDTYELYLLCGAIVVALLCIHDNRALMWLGVGVADFAITTTYARHQLGVLPPAFVQGLVDASVALAIITYGRLKWERVVGYLFQGMVLIAFAYLFGFVERFWYVVSLELANWAILFVLGGTHLLELADAITDRMGWRSPGARALHRCRAMAFKQRTHMPPWAHPKWKT